MQILTDLVMEKDEECPENIPLSDEEEEEMKGSLRWIEGISKEDLYFLY